MYVDVWDGLGKWAKVNYDDVQKYEGDKPYFVTWQIYTSKSDRHFGAIYGDFVLDFDDLENPDNSREEALAIYEKLITQTSKKNVRVYFSGKKGIHLEIDYRAYMEKPEINLSGKYKQFYLNHFTTFKTIDKSMYAIRKQFRIPNTMHADTGLYCIQLTHEELKKPISEIKKIAAAPRPQIREFEKCDVLKRLFEEAKTNYFVSVNSFEKATTKIKMNIPGQLPPCIGAALEEVGMTTGRNNMIYNMACCLKSLQKTEKETGELIIKFCQNNQYQETAAIKTIASAYRKETYFSCLELSYYCNKNLCSKMTEKQFSDDVKVVNETFETIEYNEIITSIEEKQKLGIYDPVIKTGVGSIDRMAPVINSQLYVIAANSSHGKSSFLVTLIKNNPEITMHYLPIEEGIDVAALRLNYAEVFINTPKIINIKKLGFGINEEEIRAYVRVEKPKVLLIDQLINMSSKERSDSERLKYKILMESLKAIAREENIVIILFHQLNREAISHNVPSKEHMAEGGDIERLAYNCWILFRRRIADKFHNFVNLAKLKMFNDTVVIPLDYDSSKDIFVELDYKSINAVLMDEMEKTYMVNPGFIENGRAREIQIKKPMPDAVKDWAL